MEPPRRPSAFWYLRREKRRIQEEIDEEIEFHLQLRASELLEEGIAPEEARTEAVRRFGSITSTREYCRRQHERKEASVQRRLAVEDLVQDIRIALRSLVRAPVLTLTVITTVALGIGATTVMFAAVEAAFIRPLPYKDADRLVWIFTESPPFEFRFSAVDYLALEAQQTHFESVGGFTSRTMTFGAAPSAELLQGRVVTSSYFRTLGIAPALGRDFAVEDARPGALPVVLVSDGFWRQRLAARPDAVGSPLRLDGAEHTLIGVLPPGVGPLEQKQDFFLVAQFSAPTRRGPFLYWMVGRLKAGSSHAMARSELHAINQRIFPLWKASYQDSKATWNLIELKERLVSQSRTKVGLALAAVALVWLIACLNASNLLVARVTARRRELAVRAALGASRLRIVRLLLVESSVLGAGAALTGCALAWNGINVARTLGSAYLPRAQEIALGGFTASFFVGVTVLSVAIFGLIPALHSTAARIDETLRSEGRSSTGSRTASRVRQALVGSQFAISTPLLVVATLLLVSLNELGKVDPGFDVDRILTGSVRLPAALYRDEGSLSSYWDELSRRMAATAGIAGVALSDSLPPNTAFNINNFDLENRPASDGQSQPATPWVGVTPTYFAVLGLRLVDGRLLDERDRVANAPPVVVVDRAWAGRFFPSGSAVGKRFKEGGCTECAWTTIVGVVTDVKYSGLEGLHSGTVYWPLSGGLTRFVVIRTEGDPRTVIPAVRQVVGGLDPTVPLTAVSSGNELIAQSLEAQRSLSLMVMSFAGLALVLSAIGIYGVMAFYVEQQSREISIRRALGASAREVMHLVFSRGLSVVLLGVSVGVLIALMSTRLLAALLFEVSATDAVIFVSVASLLVAVAMLACSVPARSALRLEPAALLRGD